MDRDLLKGTTVILVLSLLQQRTMYGYEMIKELEQQSDGTFVFKEGTLYPVLHTLEDKGWVEAHWAPGLGQRKRKYYAITAAGSRHLASKAAEWKQFRVVVDRVIGEAQI